MTSTLNIPKRKDGPNTRKLRRLLGHEKQEDFAAKCGWSQQKMSKLERQEVIEPADLKVISGVLDIPEEKIIEFDEDKTINNIQSNFTFNAHDTATSQNQVNLNPTFSQDSSSDKVVEALTTLTKAVVDLVGQVQDLAGQVAELKKDTKS